MLLLMASYWKTGSPQAITGWLIFWVLDAFFTAFWICEIHPILTYCAGGYQFCEEDDHDVDIENIFRSAFGGNRFFYWSFINEENPQWRSSSNYNSYRRSWNWRHQNEETYESSSESESSDSDMASDRLALGLNASGPIQLEDVKNAWVLTLFSVLFLNDVFHPFFFFFDCIVFHLTYNVRYRSCALKWHPDRHHGSSKVLTWSYRWYVCPV